MLEWSLWEGRITSLETEQSFDNKERYKAYMRGYKMFGAHTEILAAFV